MRSGILHSRLIGAALAAAIALLALAPRAPAADDEAVREYVDELTAASITVASASLVFARERTDLAVNARDYLTLTPLEINRTGHRAYFWSGYLWSTIDRRGRQGILAPGDALVLLADGRPIALKSAGTSLREQGVGEPPTRAPARTAIPVLFPATPEEIAYVSRAEELHVELLRDGRGDPFPLWKDARRALRAFVDRLELTR